MGYNPQVRPYGEYFAIAQAITASAVAGNQTTNNPSRLENAQGGTAIRMAVPRDSATGLVVAANATVTLEVFGAKTKTGTPILLGTGVFTNDSGGALTIAADATVCDFVLPQAVREYPYVSVKVLGSAAPTGSVDVFPHYITHFHGRG